MISTRSAGVLECYCRDATGFRLWALRAAWLLGLRIRLNGARCGSRRDLFGHLAIQAPTLERGFRAFRGSGCRVIGIQQVLSSFS